MKTAVPVTMNATTHMLVFHYALNLATVMTLCAIPINYDAVIMYTQCSILTAAQRAADRVLKDQQWVVASEGPHLRLDIPLLMPYLPKEMKARKPKKGFLAGTLLHMTYVTLCCLPFACEEHLQCTDVFGR